MTPPDMKPLRKRAKFIFDECYALLPNLNIEGWLDEEEAVLDIMESQLSAARAEGREEGMSKAADIADSWKTSEETYEKLCGLVDSRAANMFRDIIDQRARMCATEIREAAGKGTKE